jgi:hypothetical protein
LQKTCGCGQGGYDSLQAWIAGTFRNPEAESYFYVFPLKRFEGYAKPGIAEDIRIRKRASRGEYGDVYDFIVLTRIDSWLIEQAVLKATRVMAECPSALAQAKWEGHTEVRRMSCEQLFAKAVEFHSLLQEYGREEFAVRFLTTSPAQRKALYKMAA